jgi:hypothetical protein
MTSRLLSGLLAACVALAMGCKDPTGGTGGTAGVALYTFDSTSSQIMVWTDLNALYDSATSPAPSYQISSTLFSSKVTNLAWGGLCLDSQRGVLYLVSEAGNIVRVSRIRSQSGTLPSTDLVSFSLSSTDRLTNGKFGQASIDSQTDTLYITESGDSGTRIWVVTGASAQGQDASVSLQALQLTGDSGGTGVAAAAGVVYGFMADGSPVGTDALTGPRLRKGSATAFDPSLVILGSNTSLGIYGSLALDTANNYLFVARHDVDASSTAVPIQAFRTGQFGLSFNQAPAQTLGSATDQKDLRVLSHAGTKDWLVGLRGQGTVAFGTIYLWKAPLSGTAAKAVSAPSGALLKGVAVDGNAS